MNKENRQAENWEKNERALGLEQFKWRKRIVAMAGFIDEKDKRVLDLGAGNMHLKRLLGEDVAYYPVDCTKRFSETIVCDLNRYEFPDIHVDVAVCAGILDYCQDPEWVLGQLVLHADKIILSYRGRERFSQQMLYTEEIVTYLHGKGFLLTHIADSVEFKENWTLVGCFEKAAADKLSRNIECVGCGACVNSCPTGALRMEYDEGGFLKPVLDGGKCMDCGQCVSVCPILHRHEEENREQPECYALWAEDQLRFKSSSGGVFGVLAGEILRRGGRVFGARWTDDFWCEYEGVAREEDLEPLRKSKYVQSNTGSTYREVLRLIGERVPVLYVGCPCQIAGLKAFLGEKRNSDWLYTVDLICACAPSNVLFRRYIEETFGLDKVRRVTLRDKYAGWSPTGYRIEFQDGRVMFQQPENDDFQRTFHPGLLRSDVCENCAFVGIPRQGDLTMGDFWGIDAHDPSWNDRKGTSLLFLNNGKADELFDAVRSEFARCEKVPLEWALCRDNRIVAGAGHYDPPRRERLKALVRRESFHQAVEDVLGGRYDIGLVCLLENTVENQISTYAFYQCLRDMGYTVLIIDDVRNEGYHPYRFKFELFLKNPVPEYDTLPFMDKAELPELNARCGIFAVGTEDMLSPRNIARTDHHTCLDWVAADKYKFSYAAPPKYGLKTKYLLGRFNRVAGEGELPDPVFLGSLDRYTEMADKGRLRLPERPYVGVYFAKPLPEMDECVSELTGHWSDGVCLASFREKDREMEGSFSCRFPTIQDLAVEEWLALIRDGEFLVTNSFYAVCFALLFEKEFCVIGGDEDEEAAKISRLLDSLGLGNRRAGTLEEVRENGCFAGLIDYREVRNRMEERKLAGENWLKAVLQEAKEDDGEVKAADAVYDLNRREWVETDKRLRQLNGEREELSRRLDGLEESLRQRMDKLELTARKNRSDLFFYERMRLPERKAAGESGRDNGMTLVCFGAGDCFRRNYERMNALRPLRYVCDNDPEKWGREILPGVRCISAAKLMEMEDAFVVITVDSPALSVSIAGQLARMGIGTFDHVVNWLNQVDG